ncbi:hypothetical protein BLA29_015008 [Euroglyphus maynei]|uniref:Uncharacterized protein n=1 Tax=Euroglyphus maynei TaxID=6958 RepID=A0A1Y3BIR7_EURMA|nr:hypothetical protein BLA29_015008 [Euroglyphus maynei]
MLLRKKIMMIKLKKKNWMTNQMKIKKIRMSMKRMAKKKKRKKKI